MKIHLRQIPQGGTLHLEDAEEAGFLELEEIGASPVSPLEYALDVGVSPVVGSLLPVVSVSVSA